MSKRTRQYVGILAAVAAYYVIHEGAHLLCALSMGVFRRVNLLGLGVQIDVWAEWMTDTQMGVFCLVGALATLAAGYVLSALSGRLCRVRSKAVRAALYYVTLALLLLDPLYLSLLCGFFGGGDMNGIRLLVPEIAARGAAGAAGIVNCFVFWRVVLVRYRDSFQETSE